MESILTFDHHKRPTVEDILKNKFFDEIRNPKMEKGAAWKLKVSCEKMENVSSINKMREFVLNEVNNWN